MCHSLVRALSPLGMEAHASNVSIWQPKAGRLPQGHGQAELHCKTLSQKNKTNKSTKPSSPFPGQILDHQ